MIARSLSLTIFVALVAQQLHAAPSAAIPTFIPEEKEQCGSISEFGHQFCCHYDGVLLPNPRQVPSETENGLAPTDKLGYYKDAALEFGDYLPLINAKCHPKILTLLCFFYFPICIETPDSGLVSFFPCKSVCEEVTDPTGECSRLLSRSGIEWAKHFNCSSYTYKRSPLYTDEAGKCANNALKHKVCPPPTPPSTPSPTATTTTTTEAATKAPTEAPTESPTEAPTESPTEATTEPPTEDPCTACERK